MLTTRERGHRGRFSAADGPARFWSKVSVSPSAACWEWLAGRTASGYGVFTPALGKWQRAHRYIWEREHGPIAPGLCVCHACDNRACVNPAHLFLGTHADNAADRVAKGRGGAPTGEINGQAKLTLETAVAIRGLYAERRLSQRAIAARFGVTQTTVSRVVRGASWAHAEDRAHGL